MTTTSQACNDSARPSTNGSWSTPPCESFTEFGEQTAAASEKKEAAFYERARSNRSLSVGVCAPRRDETCRPCFVRAMSTRAPRPQRAFHQPHQRFRSFGRRSTRGGARARAPSTWTKRKHRSKKTVPPTQIKETRRRRRALFAEGSDIHRAANGAAPNSALGIERASSVVPVLLAACLSVPPQSLWRYAQNASRRRTSPLIGGVQRAQKLRERARESRPHFRRDPMPHRGPTAGYIPLAPRCTGGRMDHREERLLPVLRPNDFFRRCSASRRVVKADPPRARCSGYKW